MKPTAACVCHLPNGHRMHAAIYTAGAPDEAQQVADFDLRHHGPNHERVERLPKQPPRDDLDIPWGWTPGSNLPFPGAPGRPGAAQAAGRGSGHARGATKRRISAPLAGRGQG